MNNLNPGWNFDNTYSKLSANMFKCVNPIPVQDPKLVIFNDSLSQFLNLNFSKISKNEISKIFSGNKFFSSFRFG